MINTNNIKPWIAIIAFAASLVIGFIAMFMPPQGIIDSSILWFVAQLLVFVSGILGINIDIDSLKHRTSTSTTAKHETTTDHDDN